MHVTVKTKNGNPTHSFPDTVVSEVDIEVTRTVVEGEQESSTFHQANTVARVRILDEDTGKYCWFCITPRIVSGRPGIEVEAIGRVNETKRTKLTTNWRTPN